MKHYNPKNIKSIELIKNAITKQELVSNKFGDKHTITITFMDGSCEYEEFENIIDATRRLDYLQKTLN